jgi:alpha-L-fucosidase
MYMEDSEISNYHTENYGDPEMFGYKDFIPDFHGDKFDADVWVDLCAAAGAEFVGVTAVHHDGCALWDSDLTEWNAANMGPERDIMGELAAAVRDRDMKFATAFHHAWNWWYYPRKEGYDTMDPEYAGLYGQPYEEGEEPPEEYFDDWRDKTLEVMEAYRPDLAWFDFGWGSSSFAAHDRYRREVVSRYYNMAEEWGKDVDIAHKRNLPIGTGILDYERSRQEELSIQPWLTDTSIDRKSWGYIDDPEYKSTNTLVTGFVDRTSKNGNTLMNVGPRPDRSIPEEASGRLRAFGNWLKTNRAAIQGSRPWWVFGEGPTEVTSNEFEEASSVTFTGDDIRFTRSAEGDVGYALVMDWPDDATVEIDTSLHRRLSGRHRADDPVSPARIDLLGSDADLSWRIDEEMKELRISLPEDPPETLKSVYALRLVPP